MDITLDAYHGDITTHYSAPEIGELLKAVETIAEGTQSETPVARASTLTAVS